MCDSTFVVQVVQAQHMLQVGFEYLLFPDVFRARAYSTVTLRAVFTRTALTLDFAPPDPTRGALSGPTQT